MDKQFVNKLTFYGFGFLITFLFLPLFFKLPIDKNLFKNLIFFFGLGLLLFFNFLATKDFVFTSLTRKVFILFILIIFATIFSVDFWRSLLGSHRQWEGLFTYFLLMATYFLALQLDWKDTKLVEQLFLLLVLLAFMLSVLTVVSFLYKLIVIGSIERERGFLLWPTTFSFFLGFIWPLSLFLALNYQGRGLKKALFFLIPLTIFVANLTTFTRTTFIIMLITLPFIFFVFKDRSKILLVAIISFLLIATVFFALSTVNQKEDTKFTQRLSLLFKDGSSKQRFELWQAATLAAAKRPVFGFGPDTFVVFYRFFESKKLAHFQYISTRTPHNYFLFIASTLGLPALIVLLIIFSSSIYRGFKSHNLHNLILAFSLLSVVFMSLALEWPVFLMFPVWLLLGVLDRRSVTKVRELKVSFVLRFCVLLFLLLAFLFNFQLLMANYFYNKSLQPQYDIQQRSNLMRKAIKLNPYAYRYWRDYIYLTNAINLPLKQKEKIIHQAQKFHPYEEQLLIFQADIYWKNKGKSIQALQLLNKALKIRRHSIAALIRRGEIFLVQKNYKAAEADFKKVLELDENYVKQISDIKNRAVR